MFSIGIRGGGQTWFPTCIEGASKEAKGGIGPTGTLDLRYTSYTHLTRKIDIGFAIGASAGYGTSDIRGTHTNVFTNTDYLGIAIDYTAIGVFRQTDRYAKVDASVMVAMRFGNVTLNIGPRFMMPLLASRTFTLREATIDAYYRQYDVHVVNEIVTGHIQTPYTRVETSSLPKYNLLLTLELGYEWSLNEKHLFGVQAFVDFSVWNNYSNNTALTPLISVAPILSPTNPQPEVTIGSPENWLTGRRYMDFGIRIYYAFSNDSYRRRKPCPARDTRRHHNRYLWH